jgi:hypothetical protein
LSALTISVKSSGHVQADFAPQKSGIGSLDKVFKTHQELNLDTQKASEQVRRTGRLTIQTASENLELVLEPNDLLSPRYRAEEVVAGGVVHQLERPPVDTYRGTVTGKAGVEVRLTVRDDLIEGMIFMDRGNYLIEPKRKYESSAGSSEFILYKESDVIESAVGSCGATLDEKVRRAVDEVSLKSAHPATIAPQAIAGEPTSREIEIATEADYEYVNTLGSSENALSQIRGILNEVQYIADSELNLHYVIAYQHAWATPDDPYTSTNPNQLLTEFKNYWNANFTNVNRDVAHLWTGRDIDGDVVGAAPPGGVVCLSPSNAYSFSMYEFYFYVQANIVQHELGHNLGATHPDQENPPVTVCNGSLMDSVLGSTFERFYCQFSINQIKSFINSNASCLAPLYTISGRISSATGERILGTVTISGSQSGTFAFSQDNTFSFRNLRAGGTYTITINEAYNNGVKYTVDPTSQTVTNLNDNQVFNFTATKITSYQASGKIVDVFGIGIANVTVTLGSNTQTQTDANGNFLFTNIPVGTVFTLTPTDPNYIFWFSSTTIGPDYGDRFGIKFTGYLKPQGAPALFLEENSTHVAALESTTLQHGPFAPTNPNNFGRDHQTRLMLFARNANLLPMESFYTAIVQAEDSSHRIYALPVDFVYEMPNFRGVTQIMVTLPAGMPTGDYNLTITMRGLVSNNSTLTIK